MLQQRARRRAGRDRDRSAGSARAQPVGAQLRVIPVYLLGVLALAVAVLTAVQRRTGLPSWMPPTWADVQASARDSIILTGPVVAGIGAWVGGWGRTMAVGAVPGRGWRSINSQQVGRLVASAVVGSAIGLAPALFDTWRNATGGHLQWLSLVGAWACLAMMLAGGFALGQLWRSRIAPIGAAIAVLIAVYIPLLLTASTSPVAQGVVAVGPGWFDATPGADSIERTPVLFVRVVLFGLWGVGFVMAAAAARTRFRPDWRRVALLPMVAPIVLTGAIVVIHPALQEPTDEWTCAPVAESEFCVPSGTAAALGPTTSGLKTVADRFGFGAITADLSNGKTLTDFVYVSYYHASREEGLADMTDGAAAQLIARITGLWACEDLLYAERGVLTPSDVDDPLLPTIRFRQGLTATLVARLGINSGPVVAEPLPELDSWSDDQIRQFLDEQSNELRDCVATAPSGL